MNNGGISRAQFLRGDFRGRQPVLRPPWARDEARFDALCTGCGDCIGACEENVLIASRGRLPAIDFRRGECTFCGACEAECKTGALSRAEVDPPWQLKAVVSGACLAEQRVMCRSCGDACEAHAIRFRLAVGGFSRPELSLDRCTGCGACVQPCPVQAVTVVPEQNVQVTETIERSSVS